MKTLFSKVKNNKDVKGYIHDCGAECATNCEYTCKGDCGYACQGECRNTCKNVCGKFVVAS